MLNYKSHEHDRQDPAEEDRQEAAGAHSAHRRALAQDAEGEQEAQVEPGWLQEEPAFPELPDAQAAHEAAVTHYGEQPYPLRDEGALSSALAAAQNHYYGMFGALDADASPDPHERLLESAAKMGYGIGESQPYLNGNKRTARALTEQFLVSNGLEHVAPGHDDEEYADHLRGYGIRMCPQCNQQVDAQGICPSCQQVREDAQPRHTPEQTIQMFKQRHAQGGPDTSYVSPYPDEDENFGHTANILDPIQRQLDPSVFDKPDSPRPTLRPEHTTWITKSLFKLLDDNGYDNPQKWLSIVLTGSLTTYQYSDHSDCDLSLFVNTAVFPDWSRAEMIGLMIEHMDGKLLPGTTHPLQDFIVSPKLSKEDLYKPGLRSAYVVFGDNAGQWLVPPERERVHDVEHEENEAYTIALENADKMEHLLRYEPDKAVMFWHQIHKRRMRDQNAGKGDYSPSNITYKFLANRGLFPQLEEVSGEHIAGVDSL